MGANRSDIGDDSFMLWNLSMTFSEMSMRSSDWRELEAGGVGRYSVNAGTKLESKEPVAGGVSGKFVMSI